MKSTKSTYWFFRLVVNILLFFFNMVNANEVDNVNSCCCYIREFEVSVGRCLQTDDAPRNVPSSRPIVRINFDMPSITHRTVDGEFLLLGRRTFSVFG